MNSPIRASSPISSAAVNMFEGTLDVDEPDHAIISYAGNRAPVYLDHGVTGATARTVWAAVRPEKIELHKRTDDAAPRSKTRRKAIMSSPA